MIKKAIFILFLGFLSVFSQNQSSKAPNFELENLSGEFVELKDFLGKGPILINFWATWCKPCMEELKIYNKIYEKYKSNNLQMFAISVDNEKSMSKVLPFVRSNNYKFQVLLDSENQTARDYYVQTVPHTFLINSKGEIVYSHSGFKKGDEIQIEEHIKKLLKMK